MTLSQQTAAILHDLNIPPLSAEADAQRQSIREMADEVIAKSGCKPEDVRLSRRASRGEVYVTVAGSDEFGG